jgi:hypothetical protein
LNTQSQKIPNPNPQLQLGPGGGEDPSPTGRRRRILARQRCQDEGSKRRAPGWGTGTSKGTRHSNRDLPPVRRQRPNAAALGPGAAQVKGPRKSKARLRRDANTAAAADWVTARSSHVALNGPGSSPGRGTSTVMMWIHRHLTVTTPLPPPTAQRWAEGLQFSVSSSR